MQLAKNYIIAYYVILFCLHWQPVGKLLGNRNVRVTSGKDEWWSLSEAAGYKFIC